MSPTSYQTAPPRVGGVETLGTSKDVRKGVKRAGYCRQVPAPVEADPGRIRQIVRNLLTNAEKYGGDRVTVTSGIDGSEAFVRVADNGTGVAQAESEAIFAPYQRAAGASQRQARWGWG